MKKPLSVLLALLMLFCLTLTACGANEPQVTPAREAKTLILTIGEPTMTVNGVETPIDEQGTVPVIVQERTLLPVRAVMEQIGGTVSWNGDTQEVSLTFGQDQIRLTIGSTVAFLNDEERELDVAPALINDRTMLPIRFIAESFRFTVAWDEQAQRVTITDGAEESEKPAESAAQPDAGKTDAEKSDSSPNAGKSLVVYFSATGNTRALAEKIAAEAQAELFEIVPEEPYTSADLNYNSDCRANREQNDPDARPTIAQKLENLSDYDTVFIGYPIWWGTLPKIVLTFLDTYDLSDKAVFPFCTSGSSGISSSVAVIRSACPNADVKTGFRGNSGTTGTEIRDWLEENGFENSETDEMRVRLTVDGKELILKLNNSLTAKEFAECLPCELVFSDFQSSEKIAYPPTPFTANETAGFSPTVGDVAFYKPWGNLALFYQDAAFSADLVSLGSVEIGLENIGALSGKVKAELYR